MSKLPAHLSRREWKRGNGSTGHTYQFQRRLKGRRADGEEVEVYIREHLGEDLAEAKRQLPALRERAERELAAKLEMPSAEMTFRRFCEVEWYPNHLDLDQFFSKQNRELTKGRFQRNVFPVIGDQPLGTIGRRELKMLSGRLGVYRWTRCVGGQARPLSRQTINHVLSAVRASLNYAEEVELIERAPSFKDVFTEVPKALPRPVPEDQLAKVLAVAPPRVRLAIEVAANTGMRLGEQRRIIPDELLLCGPDPGIQVFGGRRKKEPRHTSLTAEGLRAVRDSLALWRTEGAGSTSPWGFLPANPSNMLRRLCRKALIQYFSWHRLRHTAACRYLDAGISEESIMSILGWSNVSTLRRYARRSPKSVGLEIRAINAPWAVGESHKDAHTDEERDITGEWLNHKSNSRNV